ncbi:MAG: RuBisCO large subunit C-terminal-like domain-containing protein [Silvanigrellaceae bacterium]
MSYAAKNKAILVSPSNNEAHAYATYRVDKKIHTAEIFEEIAIGQTIGAWDERFVEKQVLQEKVAKIVSIGEDEHFLRATIAFPRQLWHGRLAWLTTLVFGKMSFYKGVCLEGLDFDPRCFSEGGLSGPKVSLDMLREQTGANAGRPLLMGILKPNVAMGADSLANLYTEVAHAGVHLVKDDEIRHDESLNDTLKRVEKVAERKQKEHLKTLYVAHAPINVQACANLAGWSKSLQDAGADALLVNVWTAGLEALQSLREVTRIPLVAHPALAGAFGLGSSTDAIAPRVALGSLMRAAGADLSLFPSPYGKIGLPKPTTIEIAHECTKELDAKVLSTTPVPSAGIKPEHVEMACADFGQNFILNAGTAIFASGKSVADSAREFLNRLEACSDAQ